MHRAVRPVDQEVVALGVEPDGSRCACYFGSGAQLDPVPEVFFSGLSIDRQVARGLRAGERRRRGRGFEVLPGIGGGAGFGVSTGRRGLLDAAADVWTGSDAGKLESSLSYTTPGKSKSCTTAAKFDISNNSIEREDGRTRLCSRPRSPRSASSSFGRTAADSAGRTGPSSPSGVTTPSGSAPSVQVKRGLRGDLRQCLLRGAWWTSSSAHGRDRMRSTPRRGMGRPPLRAGGNSKEPRAGATGFMLSGRGPSDAAKAQRSHGGDGSV